MKRIITDWQSGQKAQAEKSILAIGNFDGMHRGHQALIEKTVGLAKEHNASPSVLSFTPHPRSFFNPDQDPFRLVHVRQQRRLLEALGIEQHFYLSFDQQFASLSAREFAQEIIVKTAGAACVVIGQDFRFGQNREGDVTSLKELGQELGFDVEVIAPVRDENNYVISSTIIREAIAHGDLDRANHWLGWPQDQGWEIEGPVIHGDKRGRELGYPTANMHLDDYLRPKFGIYAVRIALSDDRLNPTWLHGAANIGVRPMFETPTPLLETYIFDFDQEIYDQNARVQPVAFLRGEKRFDDLDALIKQMGEDCQKARTILKELA